MTFKSFKDKDFLYFVDTHAHLTDKAFDEDRDSIIDKSREMGVRTIITSGFNLPSSINAVEFAKKYDDVFASIGVYPENILELEKDFDDLCLLAQEKKVVAIGEIGLQYTENMPAKEKQKEGFIAQLKLANSLNLPVVIHCRDAYGDMLEILKANKELLTNGGTMHCFNGSLEVAKELLKLGLHISVGGVSTFKNATKLRETLKAIPLDKIVFETDCPYLAPHPYRGKKNAPFYIPTIAENLAEIKEVNIEDLIKQTSLNAKELFKL